MSPFSRQFSTVPLILTPGSMLCRDGLVSSATATLLDPQARMMAPVSLLVTTQTIVIPTTTSRGHLPADLWDRKPLTVVLPTSIM